MVGRYKYLLPVSRICNTHTTDHQHRHLVFFPLCGYVRMCHIQPNWLSRCKLGRSMLRCSSILRPVLMTGDLADHIFRDCFLLCCQRLETKRPGWDAGMVKGRNTASSSNCPKCTLYTCHSSIHMLSKASVTCHLL